MNPTDSKPITPDHAAAQVQRAIYLHGHDVYILRTFNYSDGRNSMSQLDVRTIQPRDRHPMIFNLFDSLKPGESFELVNDHAPTPLYYQFLHERPNLFAWDYEEEGPEVWRVTITRIANGSH